MKLKLFKSIAYGITLLFLLQCASSHQAVNIASLKLGDVYYQSWKSEIEDKGMDIVIPVVSNPNNIILDSVFFQSHQAKLEYQNNKGFIGRITFETTKKNDIIMSNAPFAEYGNAVPNIFRKSTYNLQDNQCIVSYKIAKKVMYLKIDNIKKIEDL